MAFNDAAKYHNMPLVNEELETHMCLNEGNARHRLMRHGGKASALGQLCIEHRNKYPPGEQVVSILGRCLMPLGENCVKARLSYFAKLPVDTCTCAAEIVYKKHLHNNCSACVLEQQIGRKRAYMTRTYRKDPPRLVCDCQQEEVMIGDESLRMCAACNGTVSVPLHALDKTTHLAARPKQSSWILDGSDVSSLGNNVVCNNHPILGGILKVTPGSEIVQIGGTISEEIQLLKGISFRNGVWLQDERAI